MSIISLLIQKVDRDTSRGMLHPHPPPPAMCTYHNNFNTMIMNDAILVICYYMYDPSEKLIMFRHYFSNIIHDYIEQLSGKLKTRLATFRPNLSNLRTNLHVVSVVKATLQNFYDLFVITRKSWLWMTTACITGLSSEISSVAKTCKMVNWTSRSHLKSRGDETVGTTWELQCKLLRSFNRRGLISYKN